MASINGMTEMDGGIPAEHDMTEDYKMMSGVKKIGRD